jgi:hypothetical protein
MSNYQKVDKVSYNVGIQSSQSLHSIWNEKFRFRTIPDSVRNRISAARLASKSPNS